MDSVTESGPGDLQSPSHKRETNHTKLPASSSTNSLNSMQPMHNTPAAASTILFFANSGSHHGQISHQQQMNSSHITSTTGGLQSPLQQLQQQQQQQKANQLMVVTNKPNVDSLRFLPQAFQVPINPSLYSNPRVYPFPSPPLHRQPYPQSQIRPQYMPYPPVLQYVTPSSPAAQTVSMPGYPTSRHLPEYPSPVPNQPEYPSPVPNQQVQSLSRRSKQMVIIDPVTGRNVLDDYSGASGRTSSVSSSGSTSTANYEEDIETQASASSFASEVPKAALPFYNPLVSYNKKASFASASFNKPVEITKISSPNLSNDSDVFPKSCETSVTSDAAQGKVCSQVYPPGFPTNDNVHIPNEQSKRRTHAIALIIDPATGKNVLESYQDDENLKTSPLNLNVNAKSFQMDSKTVLSPPLSVVPVPEKVASSTQLDNFEETEHCYQTECNKEIGGYEKTECNEETERNEEMDGSEEIERYEETFGSSIIETEFGYYEETKHNEETDGYEETEHNEETDGYEETEHNEETDGYEEIERYKETFGSSVIETEFGYYEVEGTPCFKTCVEENTVKLDFPRSVYEDTKESTSSLAHKQAPDIETMLKTPGSSSPPSVTACSETDTSCIQKALELTMFKETLEGQTSETETLKGTFDEFDENAENFIQNQIRIAKLAGDEVCILTDSLKSSEEIKAVDGELMSIPDNSDNAENAEEILQNELKTEQLAPSKDQKKKNKKKKSKKKRDNEKDIAATGDTNENDIAEKKDDEDDEDSIMEKGLSENWKELWKCFDFAHKKFSGALENKKNTFASWHKMMYTFYEQDLDDSTVFNETLKRIMESTKEIEKWNHMLALKLKKETLVVKILQEKKASLSSKNEKLTDKLKNAVKLNVEYGSKIIEMEETLAECQKAKESIQFDLKKKDAKIESLLKERSALSATYERQHKIERHSLQEKIRILEQKLCDLNITIENKEDAYSSIKEELSHLKEDCEKQKSTSKQLVEHNDDLICQIANLRLELKKKNKTIAALEQEKDKQISKRVENVEENKNNFKEMSKRLDQLTNQLKLSTAELGMKNEMISVLKEEIASLDRSPEQQLMESVKHITEKTSSSSVPMVMTAAIKQALGGSTLTRCVLGQLLHSLLQSKVISPDQCIEGFEPVLELLDVYSSRYPSTQDHLAEIIEPIIDRQDLTLSFLKECLLPCIPSVAAGKLVVSILKRACKKKGSYKVSKMWHDCDLEWSYFLPSSTDVGDFLKTQGTECILDPFIDIPSAESLELEQKTVFNGLSGIEDIHKLMDSVIHFETKNYHRLFNWVKTHFEDKIMDPVFIISLISVFFKTVISVSEEECQLNETMLQQQINVIKHYVNLKDKFQHYVILTLVALHVKLGLPKGIMSQILKVLLENDIVNEQVVLPLQKDKNPNEREVKDNVSSAQRPKGTEKTLAKDS